MIILIISVVFVSLVCIWLCIRLIELQDRLDAERKQNIQLERLYKELAREYQLNRKYIDGLDKLYIDLY